MRIHRPTRTLSVAVCCAAFTLSSSLAVAEKPKPAERLQAVQQALDQKRVEHDRLLQQQEALAGQLDALRKESIAAARTAQEHERVIAALERELAGLRRDAGEKQRALDASRAQQGALLGALERLSRNPPEAFAAAPQGPVDEIRGGMLLAAAVPALDAEARTLKGELASFAAVKAEIEAKRSELLTHRRDLAKNREMIGQMIAREVALQRDAARDVSATDVDLAKLGTQASDLHDLITRLDADRDKREKAAARAARIAKEKPPVDTGRPKELRSFAAAHGALLLPVSGTMTRRYGAADDSGGSSKGISFTAIGGAEVVAPFDGKVEYAGPFRGYGLILIISHGDGYHSLLAGLGRVDAKVGQWVLAGEPVGTMSDVTADDKGSRTTLYLELRHDGQPVDPQPWLTGRGEKTGDDRVRE